MVNRSRVTVIKAILLLILFQLDTVVESCEPYTANILGQSVNGFNIVLADSVLFPEGGGQVRQFNLIL